MRVIQAGVGGFGGSWLYAVREVPGFYHVALVDPSPTALAQAGEAIGIPVERCFVRLEDALANVEADGLIDVTPAPFHKQTSIAAMERGLHVLSEKPLADSMESAQEIVRVAKERQRTLMVTQQFRYRDGARFVRRLIADKVVGEIDHVVAEFQIQGLLFGWRQQMRHPFLMDMAVHHFDLLRYLLGCEAQKVTAMTWNPAVSNTQGDMSAFVWMTFTNGTKVNYTGSFASPGVDTGWDGRWTFTGSRGSLVWNPHDEWGPVRVFAQNADLSLYTEPHFFTPLPEVWGDPLHPPSIGPQSHHYDLYHWRACVEQGVEPETSGRDNLHTLALTFAAIESADIGLPVTINHAIEP